MSNVDITTDDGILALSNALNYADIRGYGAYCDGVNNDDTAIQAAISAGYKNIYLPDNTFWIPTSDLIPGGINYLGADWETVIIKSSAPDTVKLTIGAKATLTNVSFYEAWGSEQAVLYGLGVSDHAARPMRYFANNRASNTTTSSSWPHHGITIVVGDAATATYPNDCPGVSVLNYGVGDNFYAETHGLGIAFNIIVDSGAPTGSAIGINLENYGTGYGIFLRAKSGSTGTLLHGTFEADVSLIDTLETINVSNTVALVSSGKTAGTFISLYQATSAFVGRGIFMNFGTGGSFGGEFVMCAVAGAQKFYVNYQGLGYFAGGIILPNLAIVQSKMADTTPFNLWYVDGSDRLKFGAIDGASGVTLGIYTDATERITILPTGNVGIRDGSPSYELDVAGDINCSTYLRVNTKKFVFGANDTGGAGYRTVLIENA